MAFAAFGVSVAHADFTVSENLTLTQDLEWQYRGKMTIADGVTIDLNGHALHVGELAGGGCITNSDSGDSAELHIFVPYGYTYGNATVSIGGNLRLFKDGRGTFAPTKTDQTYTGGTEVTAGTMKAWSCHYPILNLPANVPGLILDAGATFDMDGKGDSYRTGYLGDGHWYTFSGGTFVNNGTDVGSGNCQLDHVRLTADSSMSIPKSVGIIGLGYGKTDLDLQGHTLSVSVGANKYFYLWNTDVTAGTLRMAAGGYLDIDKTSVRAGARFDYDPYQSGSNVYDQFGGPFSLDGGDVYQNWAPVGATLNQLSRISLTADSSFTTVYACGLIGSLYSATTLDLGGHTLYANFGSTDISSFWLFNVDATKGTIRAGASTSLCFDKTSFRGPEVTLDLEGLIEPKVPVTVSNVIVRTISTVSSGGGLVTVSGTFTPVSDWMHNFQLKNGATLNLNPRFDPFPLTSPLTGKTLDFAPNATITVDVHEHEFGKELIQVVSWENRPANVQFKLDPQTARHCYLANRNNGLFVARRVPMTVLIR